ncbi:UNVERIFIED_CONTAM: dctS [Trichonephila clavipes]
MLVRLALDATGGVPPQALDARGRLHIANNPELLSIVWYDANGRPARALPGAGAASDADLVALLRRTGAQATRPIYGAVVPDGRVTMALPLPGQGGYVSATVALPVMLDRHVPWWIAEQYGVRILGADDRVLAERQRLEPDPANPSHAISFDPPIRGTVLRITAYDAPAGFRSALMIGAIAGLAAFAILALLVLFRTAERRRSAELRLRGETAFRRSMEESLTVGLRAKDHQGRILYVNSAFCNLVGWQAGELVGHRPPMPYWDPARLDETQARHRALAAGGAISQSFETRFRRRDGQEIDVQVYEAPLIDAKGAHRGWMGSVIDITETKRAARLARAQDETMARTGRLVTLGEMASTLAHELNQPLSAIASYAAGSGEKTRAAVFADRTGRGDRGNCGLSGGGCAGTSRAAGDRDRRRSPRRGRPYPAGTGADQPDPQRDGGDGRHAVRRYADSAAGAGRGAGGDRGRGPWRGHRTRGGGAAVRRFRHHQGAGDGHGAENLPFDHRIASRATHPSRGSLGWHGVPGQPSGGRGTGKGGGMSGMIHIVDDEEAIRDALAFLLASRGVAARGWASGEEFLAAQPLEDCACVILDVRMGELSGPEVFERLRAMGNPVPVIFLTGHADVPVAVRTLKAGAFDFVEKPFNDNQIVDLALRAIAAHQAAEAEAAARRDLAARRATLSGREDEVLRAMLTGALNKQIADQLGIAMRTVEVHRGRVLAKMGVRNAIELAALLGADGREG